MSPDQPSLSSTEPTSKHDQNVHQNLAEWAAAHPILAIFLVSLVAIVINCYPVIFCGRSFVSPTCTGPMVYSWWPPLPGNNPGPPISQHGSDTGALIIQDVPAAFIESRSLLQDGEIPLWNRYGYAGNTFIGQAIYMLGDPLQFIVIFGHGAAGAWDIKFLAAKFLFCAGFGWLIFRLLGSRPLALLHAALAAYCGAFFYINIHPAFFPFAYSPWVLLSAVEMLDLKAARRFRWGLAWLLANVACFNGGMVEVAVVLIFGLNLAALAHTLAFCRRAAEWAMVLGRMAAATVLFIELTAPVWMSFLAALQGSYTVHSVAKVYQLLPQHLPGVFDDLFYQLLLPSNALAALAPGTSLLVMAGCFLSILRWRQLRTASFFWVNSAAVFVWAGCIFGWVPAALLETIPMLNHVGHNFTDFSYLLILHLMIQAAYGFLALAKESDFKRAAMDLLWTFLGFVAVMAVFCLANEHRPVSWDYFLCATVGAVGAPLLFIFLRSRAGGISLLGWAGVFILGFLAQFRFGYYNFGNQNMLMILGPREVLNAPSEAIEKIKADPSGPFRVVGLDSNFLGDYAAVYGLEDIRSCAPMVSEDFMALMVHYPGISLSYGWKITVTDPVAAQPLLNLLNVKYLLAPPGVSLQPGLDFRITDKSDFGVLENLEAWPRAFFADRVLSIPSNGEFINYLWANGKKPFVALTPEVIEQQPGLRSLNTTNATVTPATNYRLRANSTAFDIRAPSAGVVCLTENQAHDFTVTVNGEPKTVLTVNRTFKGVFIDHAGDYHVEFTYRPRHWRLACALFGAAMAVIVLAGILRLRARNRIRA